MTNLQVNSDRLWKSLMDMAKIGATEKGGVCRLALTDLDKEARDLYVKWCKEAGCTIRIDKMGNIFARRAGQDNNLAPVVTGSHIDSQPTGGRFDGVYGVLCGLEVIRALNDAKIETRRPVEASVWTNEEGSRFAPAMVASGIFGGAFDLEYGLSRPDLEGKTMGEELKRIGYAGEDDVGGRPFHAFFEAHIEQGPILEHDKKQIGVVQGGLGQRWFEVTMTGVESHAGPTPMRIRKDAMVGAASVITTINKIGHAYKHACATVGLVQCMPNSRNTIPGKVFFTMDLRHPDDETLKKMGMEAQEACEKAAKENGLKLDFKEIWVLPATHFNKDCVAAVEKAAKEFGYTYMPIISGAGHDSFYINRVAPAAMVFIPCEGGISHNEIENAKQEDVAAGCNVLLRAIVERANS
ncbi:MAG TPA: Zn-dependent hydrolase [Bacteriovoracaceae bacterium]|nr:Zn-dependent hydrolase [Bacteriovoracaceae bacterium]